MCGGCPGGSGISRISGYASLAGIRRAVGVLLQDIAAPRLIIKPFGDSWIVRDRLGQQTVADGLEDVAARIVAGPVDWTSVSTRTGEEISGKSPVMVCSTTAALELIASTPLHPDRMPGVPGSTTGVRTPLTPGQFTAGLLVLAANRRS